MELLQHLSLALVIVVMLSVCTQAAEVQFPLEIKGGQAVRERLKVDLAAAKEAIGNAKLEEDSRRGLETRIQEIALRIENVPNELPADFRTIMPFNTLQTQIFALNAPVLRAAGFPVLSAWTQNRWDPLFPTQPPPSPQKPIKINVDMMRNEYRGEAFNLTNAADSSITAYINLHGLPGGVNPGWVSVREVQFTDTYIHYPIAAALPPAAYSSEGYAITIPAGMTRQVWLSFHSTGIKAGVHRGRITVTTAGMKPYNIALSAHVYPVDMPADSSIAIGGWDYSDQPVTALDGKLVDQKAFIKFLRDYGVNTPWAGPILSKDCEYDADGRMTHSPDFTAWDAWIEKWKGARNYALYLGIGSDLLGEKMGTPRFNRMIGDWITSVVTHARSQGISPEQIFILLVDEPDKPEQMAITIAWAEAIKAAQPDIVIWSDPSFEDISKADPRFFEAVDVVCPLITRFVGSPQSYRDLFINQQSAGRELQFYACVNGKHLDPVSYHRAQFWLAIRYNAKGSFYWAFGDEGGAPSSFKAYSSPGHMFSPFFIDPQMGIVDGKHMQAIREGAEDFEYFRMLRQRTAKLDAAGKQTAALKAAKKLLAEDLEQVVQDITVPNIGWNVSKDRSVMDRVRIEVLEWLGKNDK